MKTKEPITAPSKSIN